MSTKRKSYSLEQMPQDSFILEDCNNDQQRNVFSKKNNNQRCRPFLYLIYLILQVLSVRIISVLIKELSYISVCQLSLIRFAGIFAIGLPVAAIYNKNIFEEKNDKYLLSLKGLLTATGFLLHMAAFRYLQLVEVSIVRCTRVLFTTILARIILKESLGRLQTVTLFITICGVLLSLRLPEKLDNKTRTHLDMSFVIGLIISVGSVLCLSLSSITTRKLKNIHFSVISLYSGFYGMTENVILNATAFQFVSINCGWDQMLCMLIGLLGSCSDIFQTLALQLEPASLVAIQKSSLEVLASATFGILFFSEYPDMYVISGACLVIASLFVIGIRKWILMLPVSSKIRQKFKWILT